MDKGYVSKEQIALARAADLAEYFLRSGYDCEHQQNELHIKGFKGLYVNTVTNQWHCFGKNMGGTNAVNCLTEVLGMDFQIAVNELLENCACDIRRDEIRKAEKKSFTLPERANNMRKVFRTYAKREKSARRSFRSLLTIGRCIKIFAEMQCLFIVTAAVLPLVRKFKA